jgi:hypothetical protein
VTPIASDDAAYSRRAVCNSGGTAEFLTSSGLPLRIVAVPGGPRSGWQCSGVEADMPAVVVVWDATGRCNERIICLRRHPALNAASNAVEWRVNDGMECVVRSAREESPLQHPLRQLLLSHPPSEKSGDLTHGGRCVGGTHFHSPHAFSATHYSVPPPQVSSQIVPATAHSHHCRTCLHSPISLYC